MYQKDGAAQSAPFQRMEQGIPAENLEEYGMLELLLGTIRIKAARATTARIIF